MLRGDSNRADWGRCAATPTLTARFLPLLTKDHDDSRNMIKQAFLAKINYLSPKPLTRNSDGRCGSFFPLAKQGEG
jgi:hypothetical protein